MVLNVNAISSGDGFKAASDQLKTVHSMGLYVHALRLG